MGSNDRIKILWHKEVKAFKGTTEGLKQLELKDSKKPTGPTTTIDVAGAFVAIGNTPITEFLHGGFQRHSSGQIKTLDSTMTSVRGVFACGDVSDPAYRQAATSAGTGVMAALDAHKYLSGAWYGQPSESTKATAPKPDPAPKPTKA